MIAITTTAPIILGTLLNDKCNFYLTAILIIHSLNRSFSEHNIFGLAIIIARFALYYDLNMRSNLALNLLIGLFVAKKFYSILPLLTFRLTLKMYYKSIPVHDIHPLANIILSFIKLFIINPNNFYFVPTFIWSLITGSSINFINMNYFYSIPSPPKQNSFWDPKDLFDTKYGLNHAGMEYFIYGSHISSLKKNLYNIIKSGQLGIVDENSFFIFIKNNYVIICHIISINSFSIDFQIRCPTLFEQNKKCQKEIEILKRVLNCNFFRHIDLNMANTLSYSIFSPISKNIELKGFHHSIVEMETILNSLENTIKNKWLSYVIIYYFFKKEKYFELSELFDYKVPEFNSDYLDDNDEPIDKNIFSYFNFNNPARRVYNFLNIIFREIYQNIDSLNIYFKNIAYIKISEKFPLFHNQEFSIDENESTDSDSFNEYSFHDIDYESDNYINDEETFKINVLWLIKESAKRVCLYWYLASCQITPQVDEIDEVIDFIKNIEKEYVFIDSDEKVLFNCSQNKFELMKNKFLKRNQSKNESKEIKYSIKIDVNIFAFFEGQKFIILKNLSSSDWSVFKLNRENVRSIWTSYCHQVIGLEKSNPKIYSSKKDKYRLHQLITDTSNISKEYLSCSCSIQNSTI